MAKVIRIDGVVGDWMNSAEDFQMKLDALELGARENLELIINSPGGSVLEGWAIYNKIKNLSNKVVVKIEGQAMSIASLLAMAGDTVQMSEVSSFMIHRAWTWMEGNKTDMEKQADILDKIDQTMINVYSAKTGKSKEEIEQLLEDETWFTASEALEAGFIDEIINKVEAKIAALHYNNSDKYMKNLKQRFMALVNGEDTAMTEEEAKARFEELSNSEELTEDQQTELDALVEQYGFEAVADEPVDEPVDDPVEEPVEAVTREEFNNLVNLVSETLENIQSQITEVANGQDAVIQAKVTAIAKGIKSKAKPPKTPGNVSTRTGRFQTVSDHIAKFRNEMKEIDQKTRNL